MTAIKHTLQRDVFTPNDERVLCVVSVWKAGKKKKNSFLCAAVTTEWPVQVSVVKIKKVDRGDQFKKQATWLLRDLALVDGKDSTKETAEFDLHFDKAYKWVASNAAERNGFIACLWKLNHRYLHKKIDFLNVGESLLEVEASVESRNISPGEDEEPQEDYQELSTREETDVERLIEECDAAIANAEAFAEKLSRELQVLDGANIQWIIASEKQVVTLMDLLDEALGEVGHIESTLASYEDMLRSVKEQMDQVSHSNQLVQLTQANSRRLLQEVDYLVNQLNLSKGHETALTQGDLATSRGITACTAAAEALTQCMGVSLHPGHLKLRAIQEQQAKFDGLKQTFSKRLACHLNKMFIHQGNSVGSGGGAGELSLPKHHQHHRDLLPYADLLGWLKTTDSSMYSELAKVYAQMLSKLYEKEIRNFLDAAKQRILTSSKEGRRLAVQVGAGRYTGSSSSLNKLGVNTLSGLPGTPGGSRTLATSPLSDVGTVPASDQDATERSAFDKVFEQVLAELEPVCLAEQDFLCKFFNLQVLTTEVLHSVESELDGAMQSCPHSLLTAQDFPRVDAEILQRLMAEVFGAVEMELASLITTGDRLDGLNSLYMLVNMSHHVLTAQKADSTSFLSTTLGNVLVLIKRNFDRHISGMERQMDEAKVPKKGKAGILSFVTAFEEFAGLAEAIFRNASRRGELDKAYSKLIAAIFVALEKAALESPKTPRDVVLMENYHHLFATLSRLKIGCLENERRDAKHEYADHLHAYVISSLGQPLPKLNEFFEGVEVRVAQGVKEDEVGYQLAFSKQELRKVLREYPGKEVKKGLENLYRKVEKHFCEEENLLQVVWRSLQEEFIRQYKHFEELIARCYPGSGICMEFTINDMLEYFSSIAQSH